MVPAVSSTPITPYSHFFTVKKAEPGVDVQDVLQSRDFLPKN
jgi:hypothetical protein